MITYQLNEGEIYAGAMNDIARCAGIGNDDEGWREGCEDCARRTMPAVPDVSWWIMPPPIIAFECELRIEMPNAKLTSGAAAESETKR